VGRRLIILGEKWLMNFDDLTLRIVCAGTGPESFPKRFAPPGIGDIHDSHHENYLNIKMLPDAEALYTR